MIPLSALTCDYEKVQDRSEGLSSGCSHIGGGPKSNFNACKSDAKEENGNVINWGGGNCHFKLCDDEEDLQLTQAAGGWDVYQYQCQAGEICNLSSLRHTSEKQIQPQSIVQNSCCVCTFVSSWLKVLFCTCLSSWI